MRSFALSLVLMRGCFGPVDVEPRETADTDSGLPDDTETDTESDSETGDTDTGDTGPVETDSPVDTGSIDADEDGWFAFEDCDDTDASIHPEAEDDCKDGIDSDCDGIELCSELDADYYFYQDLYGFNEPRFLPDIDGDGIDEVMWGCAGWNSSTLYGRAGIVLGANLSTTHPLVDAFADLWIEGSNHRGYLGQLTNTGDLDADGRGDLVLYERNGARLYLGSTLAAATDTLDLGDADAVLWSMANSYTAPFLGDDADGDGLGDVLTTSGGDFVVLAGADIVSQGDITGDDAALRVTSPDSLTFSISVDLDGDGLSDPVVAATSNDDAGHDAGQVYVFFAGDLPWGTALSVDDADASFVGEAEEFLGYPRAVGDVDGDGMDDLGLSASRYSGRALWAGAFHVVPSTGISGLATDVRSVAVEIYGTADRGKIGWTSSAVGDWDDDGHADLLLASQKDAELYDGDSTRLFSGSALLGTVDYSTGQLAFAESDFYGSFPSSLSHGDIDHDSKADILLSDSTKAIYLYHGW